MNDIRIPAEVKGKATHAIVWAKVWYVLDIQWYVTLAGARGKEYRIPRVDLHCGCTGQTYVSRPSQGDKENGG
ncbi:hypothetical protein ES703_66407 [subsurface metagenome]